VSPNTTPTGVPSATSASTAAPRAPYVPPTLESLGSWSALTMQGSGGVGFISNPLISRIVDGVG
jgi:hypothetical protein